MKLLILLSKFFGSIGIRKKFNWTACRRGVELNRALKNLNPPHSKAICFGEPYFSWTRFRITGSGTTIVTTNVTDKDVVVYCTDARGCSKTFLPKGSMEDVAVFISYFIRQNGVERGASDQYLNKLLTEGNLKISIL
jgi:hypothetical protein